MYSILLVEHDVDYRNSLKNMLRCLKEPIAIYEASDTLDAYTLSLRIPIDLFLLDIELEKFSGIDLANKIRTIPRYKFSWIIFFTTHIEFLIEAFTTIHCYDFILKPYNKIKVLNIIKSIIEHDINNISLSERESINLEIKSGIYIRIYIDEIIFIEISAGSVVIHTLRKKYNLNRMSLRKILSLIDSDNIVQSHKSFAVNLNYINKIVKMDSRLWKIYFENYKSTAFVGNKFKDSILNKFQTS